MTNHSTLRSEPDGSHTMLVKYVDAILIVGNYIEVLQLAEKHFEVQVAFCVEKSVTTLLGMCGER